MADKTEKRRIYLYINGKEVEDNLKSLTSTSRQLKNEIAKLTPGTDEFIKKTKELQQVNGRIADIRKEVNGLGGVFGSLKQAVGSNLFAMVSWGAAITGAASVLRGAYKTVTDFEQGIADLGALTGQSGNELIKIREEVLRVSEATGKGASDIAKAFTIVGSAQPELLKSSAALGKVTENAVLLAKAGNIDIPAAAKSITQSLNQFGKGAESAAMFTDILATSQQKGTATIEELAASMVKGGGTARAFKLDFEETNAILQGFAKGGTVGSEAGTQMAGALSKLAKVSNKEFNPAHTNAIQVIDNLAKANLSYTDLLKMTDVEGAKWITTLINQNETIQSLNGNLYDHGSALKQAEDRYDTVNGLSEKLSANYDRFIISLDGSESVVGNIAKSILTFLDRAVTGLTNLGAIADIAFGGLTSASEESKKAVLTGWELEDLSMTFDEFTSKFDKIPVEKLKGNINEVSKSFQDLLVSHGETTEDAQELWNIYIKDRLEKEIELKKAASSTNSEIIADTKNTNKVLSDEEKKKAEAEVKAKEKLAESIAKLREDAKLNAMAEDQAEVERVYLKYEKLLEAELLSEEQRKELQALRNEELDLLDEEQEAKRIAKEEKDLADRQAFLDELDLIEQSNINKELADVDAKYAALYAKADKFGIDTKMLQKLHADEISLIVKKQAQDELKVTEETQKARRASIDATINAFGSMFDSLGVIFEGNEALQKGFAIGQIAVDTAKAISSLTAMSEANPGNALTFGGAGIAQYGAGILRILASMARAKSLLSLDEGGFTGPGFGNPDSTGYKVAGYVHENEWVAPEWMTQSPQFADTIRGLEYARRTKSGYADGGFTPTSTNSAPNFDNSSNTALLESINMLNTILANGIKANAVIDQSGLLNIQDGIDELTQKQQLFK